jgi:hypothetical protein
MKEFYHQVTYFMIQKQIRQERNGLYIVSFEPKIYKNGKLLANPDYMILTPEKLIVGEVKSLYGEKKGKEQLKKYRNILTPFEKNLDVVAELILYKKED